MRELEFGMSNAGKSEIERMLDDDNHNHKWNFIAWKGWTSAMKRCKHANFIRKVMYQPENFVKFDSSLDECVFSLSTRIVPSFLSVRTCAGRWFGWTLTLYLIQLDEMVKKNKCPPFITASVNKFLKMYQMKSPPWANGKERKSFA